MTPPGELISIIMPLYRANPIWLKQSIKSILNQSYDNFELLVIMDKSGTYIDDLILNFFDSIKDEKRIKLIKNEIRVGIARSLNKGILLSKGKYIARADSDDIYSANRLELQIEQMKSKNIYLIGSWAYIIDQNNKIIGDIRTPASFKDIKRKLILHTPFIHSSITIRKKVLQRIGLYNPAFEPSEDYELWSRVISKGYLAINLPLHLIYVRENPMSVCRGATWLKNRICYIKCKGYIALKYDWGKPINMAFFLISPFALLIHPSLFKPNMVIRNILRMSGVK